MRLPPLVAGQLLGRRQRFLADVKLGDGETVVAHCANTGSMLGCKEPGSRVWLAAAADPKRKLAWTWELVEARPGVIVGIHTGRANGLVEEAINAGRIPALAGYAGLRREVRYGAENSRIDLLLEDAGRPSCYVEVKNVTAAVADGVALFPDAVSTRASKHLRELAAMVAAGNRAAIAAGVEAYALAGRVAPEEIVLDRMVPVVCP